jgi:hypothetical protein
MPFNPCERLQRHIKPRQRNRRQPVVLNAAQVDALSAQLQSGCKLRGPHR